MRRQLPGCIYVLELTGGVTKVGYSDSPVTRLNKLAGNLKLDDREILRHWISSRHIEASVNEQTLIAACERLGGIHHGPEKAREWFTGLRFEDIVAAAADLPLTACGKEEGIPVEAARGKLGDLVYDAQNGITTIITRSGNPAAMLVPLARLTDDDRWLITAARDLAAIPAGEGDPWRLLGGAKTLLAGLAAALERLGGTAP